MRKINLLFLINSLRLGGAEKLVYDIALSLNQNVYNIYVLSVSKISDELEIENQDLLKKYNISVISLDKRYKRDRIKSIFKLRKIYKKFNIDIVHTHGQSPDFYGRLSSLLYRDIKIITTIHNTKGYSRPIEAIFKNLTDQYTTVSKQVQCYMEKSLGVKSKTRLIYNGIDIQRYKNDQNSNDREDVILSVGRINSQKGYITAYEKIKSFLIDNATYKWIILGDYDTNDDYYKLFVSKIEEEVKDRIILRGAVTNPELYYKRAKLFYLNSFYEGFGIVFIEALASGIAMLVNNVGIIPELIDLNANINLISENSDNNSIRELINGFDDEKAHINQLISEKFSISRIVAQYDMLYQSILKEEKRWINQ